MVLMGVKARPLKNVHGRGWGAIFSESGSRPQPTLATLYLSTCAEPAPVALPIACAEREVASGSPIDLDVRAKTTPRAC